MSVDFTLTSKTRQDVFNDRASINDTTKYKFDCTAWEADNETIVSATWNLEVGSATLSSQSVTSGVISGNVGFTQAGKVLISILIATATLTKKIWLNTYVKDRQIYIDDYGRNA